MFKNKIAILVEDLHANTKNVIAQGNFANYQAAESYAYKLNDYYSDNCIPKIACVTHT